MKENKLTPEEIKKALEYCAGESPNCSDCPANRYEAGKCFDIVKIQAVAVMNSQQAEIERLRKECGNQSALWSKHYEGIFETAKETIKSEAEQKLKEMRGE
jgi:hypothetical protein